MAFCCSATGSSASGSRAPVRSAATSRYWRVRGAAPPPGAAGGGGGGGARRRRGHESDPSARCAGTSPLRGEADRWLFSCSPVLIPREDVARAAHRQDAARLLGIVLDGGADARDMDVG